VARNGSRKSAGTASNFGSYKFINVGLSVDDKKRLANAVASGEISLDAALELVEEGYKLSINQDKRNNSFVASLTDSREASPSKNHILTGRGSNPAKAVYSVVYRHYVLLGGDWTTRIQESEEVPDFD